MKNLYKISTLDFRNGKYQGQTQNPEKCQNYQQKSNLPNGFGIMLDENYTWVVG